MYAKNLALLLHQRLAEPGTFEETLTRFEKLRGYGLLPRGRERADQRLSDAEITSAVLGFVSTLPGWAGHVALCLSDLRPVGGPKASFENAKTLNDGIATTIDNDEACKSLISVTLSIARKSNDDEYHARILFEVDGKRRIASYVSKYATALTSEGKESAFDSEQPWASSERQLVLGREFFLCLRRDVNLSRHLDRPFETDWREYETEEERCAFHKSLGARNGSQFLNLGVDTNVTWPKDPTRIKFGGHHFVLFPKTKEYSHSISVDLTNKRLTSEEARTLLNRFLSVLCWCDDRHAILRHGWSGNPVPVPVLRRDMAFSTMHQWMFYRSMPEDEELLHCLAYYRDGLNASEAGIVAFEVLSFFKVFEMKQKDGDAAKRWIARIFETACKSVRGEVIKQFHEDRQNRSVEEYIYRNCRVATAHAAKDYPSDSDSSPEIRRLYVAAEIMRALARHFIRTEFEFAETYLSDERNKPK